MKKMIIDTNDFPIAFYDTEINTSIPTEAIDITDEQWLEFINNQGLRKWNTTTSSISIYTIPFDLPKSQTAAINQINNIAEDQRLKYITTGSGQALTYQEKAEQASDYLAAGSPADLTPYPFIQAEVNALGDTATNIANGILTAQSLWITKGAQIEELRLKAKFDINNSTTQSEIDTIVTTAITNLHGV